jgi:hypothetical protein
MRDWRYEDAAQKIGRLGIDGFNRRFAEYWLSLWRGDTPPMLSSFDPLKLAPLLSSIVMIEVRMRGSEHCRAAGRNIAVALGFDLTGKDLIALTPVYERRERIHLVEDIVLGGIALAYRPFLRANGRMENIQELALPFADLTEDGSLRYLVHTNWRPTQMEHNPGTVRADTRVSARTRVELLE